MSERRLTIDGVEIHDGGACYVIAGVGHNHQGSLEQAKELIDAAKDCGADAVKLQKRANRSLYTRSSTSSPTTTSSASDARTESIARRSSSRRRVPRAAGARARRRDHVLRDGVRLRERRLPRRARHAGVQVRLGRHPQHSVAPARGRVREADGALHRRRGSRRRRACGRSDPAAQRAALHPAMHGRVSGRHGRPEPQRHHDAPRAVPGARDRAVRSSERHCHGGRRLHARRAGDREALHAQPCGQGHGSRVLADAGGNAEARARPAARARRARRRRQATAPDRGGADPRRWGRSSSLRASSTKGTFSPRKTLRSSRRPTAAFRRTSSTGIVGRRLRRRLAPDENVELADLEPVEEPVAAHAAPRR